MRVFVTGSNGQLARSLAALEQQSVEFVFGARPEFDLLRPDEARRTIAAKKPDLVINAAAYTAVDKAETEPDLAFAVNRDGAAAVAIAAAEVDVPVVHISTDYVFSGDKSSAYVETDATGPIGVYGKSKLAGELAVREANKKHIIFRTAWVYSTFGANFVKTMLRVGRERPELRVVNDQIGNPTSAHDLARALLMVCHLAGRGKTDWGTYHLAGSGDTSWYGLAEYIFKVAAEAGFRPPLVSPIPTLEYPTPAKRPQNSRLDCSFATKVFGVDVPEWQESVRQCVLSLLSEDAGS